MKLIENYIICDDGNIFSNGKLLSDNERRYLASNTTNQELLKILSQDDDWDVRSWVAFNSSTPINILKNLSQDNDHSVRYEVARNSSTPIDILKKLSQDKNAEIQYCAKVARKKANLRSLFVKY